jgi:intergrase/recombinase
LDLLTLAKKEYKKYAEWLHAAAAK